MKALVSAPSLRKNPHGLVEAGNTVDVGTDRWEQGLTFTPNGCQTIFGHVPFCPAEGAADFNDCPPPADFNAYVLEAGLQWATGDHGAGPKEMLLEAFSVGTSAVLERLASSGINDQAGTIGPGSVTGQINVLGITGRVMGTGVAPPVLQDALDTDVIGPPAMAIGAVEAKLLDASDHVGSPGTILISPFVAAQCASTALVTRDGQLYTAATDCKVIVGNFSPPDIVYGVLGEVDVYLSPVVMIDEHEHGANEWYGLAQRYAAVVWNTCAGPFRAQSSATANQIPPFTGTIPPNQAFNGAFLDSAFS